MRCTTVVSRDALRLHAYSLGNTRSQCAIVINGFGMSHRVIMPLLRELARHFHVVTWESRGLPGDAPTATSGYALERHEQDAADVLRAFHIENVALVAGWSSGARVALKLVADAEHECGALLLIGGAFQCPDTPELGARAAMRRVLQRSLEGAARAEPLARVWRLTSQPRTTSGGPALPDELLSELALPYRDGESLHRYALTCLGALGLDDRELAAKVCVPTVLAHGARDQLAPVNLLRPIEHALRFGWSVVLPEADHYLPWTHAPELARLAQHAVEMNTADRTAMHSVASEPLHAVVRSVLGYCSVWPVARPLPAGWSLTNISGTRQACLKQLEADDPSLTASTVSHNERSLVNV